jgi:hypothetical protein
MAECRKRHRLALLGIILLRPMTQMTVLPAIVGDALRNITCRVSRDALGMLWKRILLI